ncbi:uncharacterized protein N7459_002705 [Penicillium hispanicum]|uniref:uncharacterized protein n=1 Tax=Penicillium hispanicum TaxID=1080232 RepID=UPI002541BB05|nr:uncharacterized protein N7459_002705 [Penicillium hispanicum]KAJ5586940.1 hypothetical protein N7459_002705 [Penicillium hispanicum]
MASMDYGLGSGFEPKHVDRKSIYVHLEDRIKYLQDFLEWSSADVEALQNGTKYLKQLIPAVVNLVYKKILQYDITSRAFHTRTTTDEKEVEDDYLTEETPQIKRRKMFLRWYLIRLCQDPTSMEFWKYLNKVGMMHSGQERMHALNIEYVHIGACLGYIQDIFVEALMSHPQISLRRKIALVRAINKIIWIQNDLFSKWRIRDGEEYADEVSMYSFGSREGYVGDQKILGSGSSSSADDDAASVTSSTAPSVKSVAPSTAPSTATTPIASQGTACPFADFAKNTSHETKIWAN